MPPAQQPSDQPADQAHASGSWSPPVDSHVHTEWSWDAPRDADMVRSCEQAVAAGLRLPTLPVAVAFVRACGGNVAEWEERWQKIADKVTAEAARKRRADGDETAEPVEPADAPAALETPKPAAPPPPESDGGEVYVITSAPPRQPGW